MSCFTIENLSVGYGKKEIVHGVSLSLERGRLLGVLGANGSGKTTLLKSICGILPHSGACTLGGTVLEDLSAREMAKKCSYIPQRSGIAIDISALDVVLMGFNPRLGLLEHPGQAMRERAVSALERVGLAGREHENYLHLSEGQKQLTILARTLISDGSLLLLDEPESALDFRYRYRTLEIIREWVRTGDRCGIIALHDPMLALNFCDELLLLKDGRRVGLLRPGEDSLKDMEAGLSEIYGPVSLCACRTRNGREHLVMLKEQEAEP